MQHVYRSTCVVCVVLNCVMSAVVENANILSLIMAKSLCWLYNYTEQAKFTKGNDGDLSDNGSLPAISCT